VFAPEPVSYKSEDVERVARLAKALQGCGFDVWWDRYLSGGENWNARIQSALESAKCVVVVWTHASVGSAGDFVRDEAREGKRRSILVPVRLDRVGPPLGFREIQAVDLTRWKGSARDPFFRDLVEAIKAKMEGRPVPAAKGPMLRLRQRLTYGTLTSALVACVAAFGSNSFSVQNKVCSASIVQPGMSDVCGAFGFGGRPPKSERLVWQTRRPGNCADLRKHLGRFPDGAYRSQALSLLADRHEQETESWDPAVRPLSLVVSGGERAFANKDLAQADALARAQHRADALCSGFGATTLYRFKSAKPEAEQWQCSKAGSGISCGFEGQAICQLEVKDTKQQETCGK
jgi:TIR domain